MTPDLSKIKKILIIQYQPFGDVLLNTGYLPVLRNKFPSAKIDFLVREPYHNALLGNPYLDDLVLFKNAKGFSYFLSRIKLIKDIRSRKYDLIIDQIIRMDVDFRDGAVAYRYICLVHRIWVTSDQRVPIR